MDDCALDARAWLAVFPQWPPSPRSLSDEPRVPDAAAELRASQPLDRAAVLAEYARAGAAPLAWLVRLTFAPSGAGAALWLGTYGGLAERHCAAAVLLLAPIAAAAALAAGSPRFPPRNIALGTVAACCQAGYAAAAWAFWHVRHSTRWAPTDFSYTIASQWIRAAQLKRLEPGSPLLAHDDEEELCPCDRSSCAGNVARDDAAARFFGLFCFAGTELVAVALLMWTPAVTFASQFWSSPWALTLFLALLAYGIGWLWTDLYRALTVFTIPAVRYSSKLSYRAVFLAISDLLARFRTAIAASGPAPHRPREPYLDLGRALTARWSTQLAYLVFVRAASAAHAAALLAALVLNAAASCICAWQLASLTVFLTYLALEFVGVAEANAQVSTITRLLSDARAELRALCLRAAASSDAAHLVPALALHDRMLGSLVDAPRFQVKFAGFVVTFGFVRTLFVTVLTVLVGVWGILRGGGVRIVWDSLCPAD